MSAVLRRLKWIIAGFNNYKALKFKPKPSTSPPTNVASIIPPLSPKQQHQKSTNHKPRSTKQHQQPPPRPPPPMLESVHEIGVYIHRFHNLDLFRQGWYQIKITMRLEDTDYGALAAPSRVVQYEAPDLGSEDTYGVWRIDDTDHSFSTQPFRIKYARQDILLSVMISFNLSLGRHVGPSTSAVIMKFELFYAASSESRFDLDASLDPCEGAVHEFRIPAKALLGLHSYCPVHFNHDYAVLVDVSVHITLLKGGIYTSSTKVLSESCTDEDVTAGHHDNSKQKQVMLVKSLLVARDLLLEELQKLSKAINQKISLTDFSSNLDKLKLFGNPKAGLEAAVAEVLEESNGGVDFQNDGFLNSLSKDDLFYSFHAIGDQLLYLWNTFLNFHRANKTNILEFLHDSWANDRKSEWSIWMVHSKVDMPHQYISSTVECAAIHCINGKTPVLRKLTEDPAQAAAMRAQLHRRSIAQMRINNRSIQDMHIFGNPSHVPVVIVESVVNTPRRSTSGNSYFGNLGQKKYSRSLSVGAESNAKIELCGVSTRKNVRDLKIVVFVHGFQGHHLDLRLIRNQWLLIDPKIEFLMSEANQEKTTGDFREMGQRLAQEVVSFIKKKMDKISRSGVLKTIKLSFVGHSIGNLIIRTALTEGIMEPYLGFLYTYVSVSGPHIGYLYSSNSLFNSGLWVMKKLSGTQCIHQLTFTDHPDIRNTFLYKLCKEKTLENFKNIILLSSPQDGYVPYHSARIEMCPASAGDNSKKGKAFLEMLNDCLDQIRARSSDHRVFMRFDVDFDISQQGNTLDTIIGRAAHIQFLESDIFTKFIMWTFPDLFR